MKTGIIYIIRNKINSKVYIGQTTSDVATRFHQHLKKSTISTRHYKIYNAIKKYGKENFFIEILEENVPIDQLNQREIFYIEKYDSFENGYNSSKGGDGRVINKDYDEKQIIDDYLKGSSMNEICAKFNVSNATISRVLKRLGIETRHDGNKYESIDPVIFQKEWYQKTSSIKQLAEKYNVDEKTIRRLAKRLNLRRKGTKLDMPKQETKIVLWSKTKDSFSFSEQSFEKIEESEETLSSIKDKKIIFLIGDNPIPNQTSFGDKTSNYLFNHFCLNGYDGCVVLNLFSVIEEQLLITIEKIDCDYLKKQINVFNSFPQFDICLFYGSHVVYYMSRYRLPKIVSETLESYYSSILKHNVFATAVNNSFAKPTMQTMSKMNIKNATTVNNWQIKGKI